MNRRKFLKGSALVTVGAFAQKAWPKTLRKSRSSRTGGHVGALPPLEWIAWNRLAHGPAVGDLASFRALGRTPKKCLERFLEEQLHPESISDSKCDLLLQRSGWATLSKPLKKLWADHSIEADRIKESSATQKADHELRLQPAREVEAATWLRTVYSQRQLSEKLVGFWHDHFNVYAWEQKFAPVFVHYDREVIRAHAFGNFRELLEAVAKSPAMLFYLDNHLNQSGNPNENYARELFELHTLGAENYLGTRDRDQVEGYSKGTPLGYVDGDVYEAARCFTGWKVDTGKNSGETGEFAYFEPWHDRFQKIVLGRAVQEYQPPLKDGHDVLDRLAEHPGTARAISRKLCRRFICEEPSESLVARVARVFHENTRAPDQIRKTLRAVALSPEFSQSYGTKMKRPMESLASSIRLLGADFTPNEEFIRAYPRLRQKLFNYRTPDGFPDRRQAWSGATTLIEHWKVNQQLLMGKFPGVEMDLWARSTSEQRQSPRAFLSYWARHWSGLADVDFLITPALEIAKSDDRQKMLTALSLVLDSPHFQRI